MPLDPRDQTICDLRGALASKELELEILRHRLRLKEQATMAATVLPTVSRKGQDAEAMLAELEAENQELRGRAWELEQYVAILEGRLQAAEGAGDVPQKPWDPLLMPTRRPEDAATVLPDATVVASPLSCETPMTQPDPYWQQLEDLRAMLLQRDSEVADLQQQLATVELGLANVLARKGGRLEVELVMEDLASLYRPLTQRGALQGVHLPENNDGPALSAHTAELEAQVAELRQRCQRAAEQQQQAAWEAQALRAEMADLQQQLAEYEALRAAWAEGSNQAQHAEAQMEALAAELEQRETELGAMAAELEEERARTEALRERIGELLHRAQQAEMTVVEREEELSRTVSCAVRPGSVLGTATAVEESRGRSWLARAEGAEAELEELRGELAAKAALVSRLEGLLSAAPSPVEVRALKERLRQRDAEVTDLQGMLRDQRAMTAAAEGAAAALEARCAELQAHVADLRRLRGDEKPRAERHTCLKCDLYATQLAAQREELEATITDLRYEVENLTVELAARAVNIADMSARLRQMEDDLHSVDTLKKQIEDLKASKDFLTAELETLQLNDYHHSGHRRAQKDRVLVITPGEPVDKKKGWRELISSKHQVQFNAVELAAEEGEAVKGAVIKSRSGQGVCVTFGEDFLNGGGLERPSSQHLRAYQPYTTHSPSESQTSSPSPKYILARSPGSPTGRPAVLVRSPSNLQWM